MALRLLALTLITSTLTVANAGTGPGTCDGVLGSPTVRIADLPESERTFTITAGGQTVDLRFEREGFYRIRHSTSSLWNSELHPTDKNPIARRYQAELLDKLAQGHVPSLSAFRRKAAPTPNAEPTRTDEPSPTPADPHVEALRALTPTLDQARVAIQAEALPHAQAKWHQDPLRPFADVLREVVAAGAARPAAAAPEALAEQPPAVRAWYADELARLDVHEGWIVSRKPDLTFGEKMVVASPAQVVQVADKKRLVIDQLAKLGTIGGPEDLGLLKQALGVLSLPILNKLREAKYAVTVARNNITNGARGLKARKAANGALADEAEGVHYEDETGQRSIVVRSFMEDGLLVLDVHPLLHEIGHGADLVLAGKNPLHQLPGFVEAFTEEHQNLRAYFHTPKEFVAEVFARFALDRERTLRRFPKAVKALEHAGYRDVIEDVQGLGRLIKSMVAEPPVTARPDPVQLIAESESFNGIRAAQARRREPMVIELGGEPAARLALARNLANHLIRLRAPLVGPFGTDDGFAHLGPAVFNDPVALRQTLNDLADANGALVYVDDLHAIPATSPGFKVLDEVFQRRDDQILLVLGGDPTDFRTLASVLPTIARHRVKIESLTPPQVTELIRRDIMNDGYEISEEALARLFEQNAGGGYEGAIGQWRSIKQAQMRRLTQLAREIKAQPEAISYVLERDVVAGKVERKNPLDDIARMIGLKEAKAQITHIISNAVLAKRELELGIRVEDPPRINLLFAGNPGTGKTTFAIKMAESLFLQGYVRRKAVAQVKAQDLTEGSPDANVKRLFENNKDGTIFVDEFHQLKDTEEGKRAFRAMIPYLASPDYQGTAFIGSGYPDELRDLIRELDPGGERRFRTVEFADFAKDDLERIMNKMLDDKGYQATPEVRASLLEQVVRKQRAMKHPGNAGDVETLIDEARAKQRTRLAETGRVHSLDAEEIRTLTAVDVARPAKISVAEVWDEINALNGLDDAKAKLHEIQDLIDYNREMGADILTGIEPYIIIEGPAGSGKSTLAALVGRLFAANDVIPDPGLVKAVGGDLVGGFVGNSTVLAVRKMFESAWGKTLFIDEIGALAKAAGGYEEQASKEIVTQTENNRGKLIMIIADYPHNVSAFLNLDDGLAGRFGTRLTLEVLSGRNAADRLSRLLAELDLDAGPVSDLVAQRLGELAELPQWASGRDVRTLATKVRTLQAARFMAGRRRGEHIDPRVVHPDAINQAIDELEGDIRKRPATGARRPADTGATLNHMSDRQSAGHTAEQKAEPLTESEKRQLEAISDVDVQFGAQMNDAEELARQEADPNSAYNQALGQRLGISPDQAHDLRRELCKKMKIVVKVLEREKIQHFKYHCPYCGGVESPHCAYIGYPLDWKIQHSTRKPWTEERDVLRDREVELK